MSFDFIHQALAQREAQQLLRQVSCVSSNVDGMIEIDGAFYLNFASNDYLGLSQHQEVLQSYVEGLSQYGASSSASPLVTGYNIEHQRLEQDLCEHVHKPAAILFSSGFAANQALCMALFADGKSNNGQIIADKFMHASFVEGAVHCGAKFQRYRHQDMAHLQQKLPQTPSDLLIATEGIFSMDGDQGDIAGLAQAIGHDPQALLMVDDAHAIGVIGEHGMGSCDIAGTEYERIDIVMGTFGKAVGTAGAFVAGSDALISYLRNFSRHYVYSTATSPAQARATLKSLQILRKGAERERLQHNIEHFKQLCVQQGVPLLASDSPIQPVIIGSPDKTLQAAQKLKSLGMWVGAIRSPTVPKGTDRLRITICAQHQTQDIQALVDALSMSIELGELEQAR